MAKRVAKPSEPVEPRGWRKGHDPSQGERERRQIKNLKEAVDFLFVLEKLTMAVDAKIVEAQSRLDAAVATLQTDVAALKATLPTPADTDAVVAGLDATTAAVNALDATVKPA